jgi:Maf1 regulator
VASALLEVSRVRPPGRIHPSDLHAACSPALELQCFLPAHVPSQVTCRRRAQIWDSMPGYSDCSFADSLWSAMDEAICLPDCDVYSYKSDGEDDPFGAIRSPLDIATCSCHLAHCVDMRLWHGRMIDYLN